MGARKIFTRERPLVDFSGSSPVKGLRLDNLAVFSVPWRFCNCYGFFPVFEILNFRQINSTQLSHKNISQERGKSGEISFLLLKTKKPTFFNGVDIRTAIIVACNLFSRRSPCD